MRQVVVSPPEGWRGDVDEGLQTRPQTQRSPAELRASSGTTVDSKPTEGYHRHGTLLSLCTTIHVAALRGGKLTKSAWPCAKSLGPLQPSCAQHRRLPAEPKDWRYPDVTKPALPNLGAHRNTPKDPCISTACPPSTSTRRKVRSAEKLTLGRTDRCARSFPRPPVPLALEGRRWCPRLVHRRSGDTGAEVPGLQIGSPGTWVPGSEPVRRGERLRLPSGAGSLRSFRPIPFWLLFSHCNSVATARQLLNPESWRAHLRTTFRAPAKANLFDTNFSRREKKRLKQVTYHCPFGAQLETWGALSIQSPARHPRRPQVVSSEAQGAPRRQTSLRPPGRPQHIGKI
ncbi:uncharacterized protein LOC144377508 [Ictidomys tridecemlineatus]